MVTIVAKLEKGHWVATETEVETLALERYTSNVVTAQADGTYLRVLIVAAQAQLGRPRGRAARLNAEAQLTVLTAVNGKFYPAVLRGITTPDVAVDPNLDPTETRRRSLERNARSAFARSALSTLAGYVRGGGDLRTIDVTAVTKTGLRAAVAPAEPADKIARQIQRASGALLRAVGRRARDNPDEAREDIENVMTELQRVLDGLGEGSAAALPMAGARVRDTGPARTRVGTPIITPAIQHGAR